MLVDVKQYMKDNKIKNISDTVRAVLAKYSGWKDGKSPSGNVSGNGCNFWTYKTKTLRSGRVRKVYGTNYMLPVRKAGKIELDTKQGLLIFDEILAINIK